jgi:type IV pilus assembly protein PilE
MNRNGLSNMNQQIAAACRGMLHSRGFTLIELMIVVVVVAILAALAYPSYTSYIVKTHRKAAEGCLSEYANYMERYYTSNLSYKNASVANTPLDCKSQTSAWYTYSFPSAPSSTEYTVQAVPVAGSVQAAKDAGCGTLSLDQTGARNVSGSDSIAQCWQ